MKLSAQQERALDAIGAWRSQLFVLAGYAGTGKTTLLAELAERLGHRARFLAPTGKAVNVLRRKLGRGPAISTIHSLIYRAREYSEADIEAQSRVIDQIRQDRAPDQAIRDAYSRLDELREAVDQGRCDFLYRGGDGAEILVVDEASMVSERLEADLLATGARVLFVGDPGQLPPVAGRDFFERHPPDVFLNEVHRQAAGSAILRLATSARLGEPLKDWVDECELLRGFPGMERALQADVALTGGNATRRAFNSKARARLGHEGLYPRRGEPLICLRNDHDVGLVNGGVAVAVDDAKWGPLELRQSMIYEGTPLELPLDPYYFELYRDPRLSRRDHPFERDQAHFDFAYCLTVHKAQGSEWDHVLVVDDGMRAGDKDFRRRWAYTAITRAARRLTWVARR